MRIFGLVFLFFSFSLYSQKAESAIPVFGFEDEIYKELSLKEWKKFKAFEEKLGDINKAGVSNQLKGFVRDSIQILGVKLMATKLLNERQLLDKDIAENGGYYADLLQELHDSTIPQVEYLFLEEKMALINQAGMEKELSFSRWLNLVLLLLCMAIGYWAYHMRNVKTVFPELSKQEHTVRNLILEGKSNKEIANELFISLSTVKTHITNLYAKLNVTSRRELLQKGTGTSP
ncbi:MAG: response regulator transcription factor [Croceivirga sp.]